jgi:succinyl-CoA synthetase beta subunit
MALNGKIRVNERAINRHPEIADMARRVANNPSLNQIDRILINGDNLETIGKIGILGNGIGSVLTTLDLITNAGGKPGMCLNLRHSFLTDISPTSFYERLEKGLNILATDKTIQVILLNFLGTIPQLYKMPEIITKFIQLNHPKDQKNKRNLPSLVVRLAGSEFNGVKKYLASLQIPDQSLIVVENLDTAVAESIRLAKLYTYKK